jgi:peptidoglycan/LPS O-acetylase OafA/YrhL
MNLLRKCAGPGLFRLVLASAVVVYHLSRFAIGAAAVYLFFILSGFWIYRMWMNRYSKASRPYLVYLLSRSWRLIPTFVLVSAIAMLLERFPSSGAGNHVHYVVSQIFILGYSNLSFKPIVPAWSLDIEMQFYLLAPALVWLIARQRVISLLAGFAVISLISGLFLGAVVTSYLIFFVIGMCAAAVNWQPSAKTALKFSLAGVGLLLICAFSPLRSVLLVGAHPGRFASHNLEFNILFALTCAPYALFTTRQRGFAADEMFADLSYIVYLLHWPLMQRFNPTHWLHSRLLSAVCVCAIIYAAAFLIWKFYDKPINRLRAAWTKRRIAGATKPVPATVLISAQAESRSL